MWPGRLPLERPMRTMKRCTQRVADALERAESSHISRPVCCSQSLTSLATVRSCFMLRRWSHSRKSARCLRSRWMRRCFTPRADCVPSATVMSCPSINSFHVSRQTLTLRPNKFAVSLAKLCFAGLPGFCRFLAAICRKLACTAIMSIFSRKEIDRPVVRRTFVTSAITVAYSGSPTVCLAVFGNLLWGWLVLSKESWPIASVERFAAAMELVERTKFLTTCLKDGPILRWRTTAIRLIFSLMGSR